MFHNGSKEEIQDELKKIYPGINHKVAKKNNGYSGGFNSTVDWIFSSGARSTLFLTNDTKVCPDTLSRCLETERETGVGIIAPTIFYLKYPEKIDSSGGFFDPVRFTLSHYHDPGLPLFLQPGRDYIPGTALWITKEVFLRTGGMDEDYNTYWEDADLSFRCHNSGIRMARSFKAKILHGVGQTCHKKPLYTTYYFQRNRIKFCKRFLTGKDLERSLDIIRKNIEEMGIRSEAKNDLRRIEYLKDLKKLLN